MDNSNSIEMPDFSKMKNVFRNMEISEDVRTMLQSLAKENNVPNDIFEHVKLISDVHYLLPVYLVAGHIEAPYSYEKQKGDKIYHYEDTYMRPVCYKLPAYVGTDVPKEAWVPVEMFDPDYSTTYIPPENLEKQKVGWSIVEPDAGDVQEMLTFWGKDMAQLFKEQTREDLKKNLGSVDKLNIKNNGFCLDDSPGMDPISLAFEEVAIVEYDYKGITYKCVCRKDYVKHVSLPQDTESREVERQLNLRKNICLGAMALIVVLQFALIHSWAFTLIALLIAFGVWYKFNYDLKKIQKASSGSRQEKLNSLKASDFLEPLKSK